MEAVPLQVTYQSAIQSVIISGNENRRIGLGLQGLQFTFMGFAGPLPPRARRLIGGCAEATTLSPIRSLFGDYLYADCAIGLGKTHRKLRGGEVE
jgi:hypothetical protein